MYGSRAYCAVYRVRMIIVERDHWYLRRGAGRKRT